MVKKEKVMNKKILLSAIFACVLSTTHDSKSCETEYHTLKFSTVSSEFQHSSQPINSFTFNRSAIKIHYWKPHLQGGLYKVPAIATIALTPAEYNVFLNTFNKKGNSDYFYVKGIDKTKKTQWFALCRQNNKAAQK